MFHICYRRNLLDHILAPISYLIPKIENIIIKKKLLLKNSIQTANSK